MTSWWYAAIPAAALAGYAAHAAFKYTRMIGGIFLSLVYKPADPPSASTTGEKVLILDSAGNEIEAIAVEKRGSKKLAIFCHESGRSKESWEKYAYFLPAAGYGVLSLDFRKTAGESDSNPLSQWPTEDDVARVHTAIRWAKKAYRADLEVVLFGVSNGADIAFAASFGEPAVKAVVADGLFSMKEIFRDYIRKWAPILVKPNLFGEKYPGWVVRIFTELGFWYSKRKSGRRFIDIEKYLNRPHAPLLLIHGAEDDYVPASHQKFLRRIDSKLSPSRVLEIAHAGHNEAVVVERDAYRGAVLDFLKGGA